nr:MAG TPA: hypothetical protein [Caudoviricetes sp.]
MGGGYPPLSSARTYFTHICYFFQNLSIHYYF